jgi:hypothetical protein
MLKIAYLSFRSVFLVLGENNFLTEALMPVSFLVDTLLVTALFTATLAVTDVEATGATVGFATSAAKTLILKLPVISPANSTDKNLFILTSPNTYKINVGLT